MMNKRSVCMVVVVALLLGIGIPISTNASEPWQRAKTDVSPYYDHTMSIGGSVVFVDDVAYAYGGVTGYSTRTTRIDGFLYLQRQTGDDWLTVRSWTDSVYDWNLDIDGEASGLSSGTYRVRFVANVYEGSSVEQVEFLSSTTVYTKTP